MNRIVYKISSTNASNGGKNRTVFVTSLGMSENSRVFVCVKCDYNSLASVTKEARTIIFLISDEYFENL